MNVLRFTNEFIRASTANGLKITQNTRSEIDKRIREANTSAGKLKLNLRKCSITDEHLKWLFLSLDMFPILYKLDISANEISTRGLEIVSNFLQAQLKYASSIPIDNRLESVFLCKLDYANNSNNFSPRIIEEVGIFSGILLNENAKVFIRQKFKKLHGQVYSSPAGNPKLLQETFFLIELYIFPNK